MRSVSTEGSIMVKDPELLIAYRVADIVYTEWEDGTFEYEIEPDYGTIDLVPGTLFQGIPGLNLDLRRTVYRRRNMTPVFISERAPATNREDVRELIEGVGLDRLDKLEWLIRTDTRYAGDGLYVQRRIGREPVVVGDMAGLAPRSAEAMRLLLCAIGEGREIRGDGFRINASNVDGYHALLRALYAKEKGYLDERRRDGVSAGVAKGNYRGRRRKELDGIAFAQAAKRVRAGSSRAEDEAKKLGVSRATFYRRMRDLQGEGEEQNPVLLA